MILLRTFASCLLFSIVVQQVSLTAGARKDDHRERRVSTVGGIARRSGDVSEVTGRGKFTKDKMKCTWTAREVEEKVKVSVVCEDPVARRQGGVTDLWCNYYGKPRSCPAYASNPSGFWKQVSRAFKRLQGKACSDDRALVKAGMCKRAPREAHFKLDISSSVAAAQSGGESETRPPRPRPHVPTTAAPTGQTFAGGEGCAEGTDHRKTADEYCSSSWASVCSFFLSMLQSGDC
ncbi:hypothetical protein LDENG_00093190 [Lucifuga dentata]|nr:hypothetical protein LDENG_00093190 [Lucifuga dentata]